VITRGKVKDEIGKKEARKVRGGDTGEKIRGGAYKDVKERFFFYENTI